MIARRDAFDKGVRRVLEEGMSSGVFADGDPKLLAFALFGELLTVGLRPRAATR